jgi:glycosyltransferase involved in cell wall biosynthesis
MRFSLLPALVQTPYFLGTAQHAAPLQKPSLQQSTCFLFSSGAKRSCYDCFRRFFCQVRIVHVWILTHYFAPEVGAAAIRLSRLAQAFANQGHQVTVITAMPNYPEGRIAPSYRGRLFCSEEINGVRVRRVWLYTSQKKSALARILNQISFAVLAALRATFFKRPDVILVESHPLFVCLSGGWLKRIKRAPIVLNVSDLWPESAVATGALSASSPIVKFAVPVERWAYRDAAHVIAMTEGVMQGIVPFMKRVTLIRNAVDLTRFLPSSENRREGAKKSLGFEGKFVAVHVGNMSLTYDFDILLNTAKAVPELHLVFAGGGSQFETVRAKAEMLENVHFTGTLPHQQMPELWAAADICLIALRDHGVAGGTLPAKMYEALATGTPVVAAIRGEGATMLTAAGAGIAVPIGDTTAMISAVQQLCADPELRRQMSQSGRDYAEKHLQLEENIQAYLRILSDVV